MNGDGFPGEIILILMFIPAMALYLSLPTVFDFLKRCKKSVKKTAHEGVRRVKRMFCKRKNTVVKAEKLLSDITVKYIEQLRHENKTLKSIVAEQDGALKKLKNENEALWSSCLSFICEQSKGNEKAPNASSIFTITKGGAIKNPE